jgi:hypothetical protein
MIGVEMPHISAETSIAKNGKKGLGKKEVTLPF